MIALLNRLNMHKIIADYITKYSPVVEDDQGIQLRKKWYKGKFLLLGTTFNGQ